jgi:uncharacterized RDD family membrane protein YckC
MSLDTRYTAETPEGIALAMRPAGVVARFYAYLVDFLIRLAIFLALSKALDSLGAAGVGLLLITYFLLEWFYPVLFELLPGHATPGKRVLGLMVVMDSGLPVTPAGSLVRNFLRAVDFLPAAYALGFVTMLCRADFKRLGDLAAGTLVVYRQDHGSSLQLRESLPEAPALAPRRPLSSSEQAAIIDWASRSQRLTPSRTEELASLAQTILPANRRPAEATAALMGVAQWLLGRR